MKTASTSTVSLQELHIDLLKLWYIDVRKHTYWLIHIDTTPNNYSFGSVKENNYINLCMIKSFLVISL